MRNVGCSNPGCDRPTSLKNSMSPHRYPWTSLAIVAVARTVKRNFTAQGRAYRSRLQTFTGNGDVFTRVKKKCSRGDENQHNIWGAVVSLHQLHRWLNSPLQMSKDMTPCRLLSILTAAEVYSRSCSLCSVSVCARLPSCPPLSKFCERVPNHNCEIKWSNKVSRFHDIYILLYFQLMSIWEF